MPAAVFLLRISSLSFGILRLEGRLVGGGQLLRERGDDGDGVGEGGPATMAMASAATSHFDAWSLLSGACQRPCRCDADSHASDSRRSVRPRWHPGRYRRRDRARPRAHLRLARPARLARGGGPRADRPRHRLAGRARVAAPRRRGRCRRRHRARFEAAYEPTVGTTATLYPGVAESLRAARRRGLPLERRHQQGAHVQRAPARSARGRAVASPRSSAATTAGRRSPPPT